MLAGIAYNLWGKGTCFEKNESAKIRTAMLQILPLLFSQEPSSHIENPFLYMRIGAGPYFTTFGRQCLHLELIVPGPMTRYPW